MLNLPCMLEVGDYLSSAHFFIRKTCTGKLRLMRKSSVRIKTRGILPFCLLFFPRICLLNGTWGRGYLLYVFRERSLFLTGLGTEDKMVG